MSCPYQMKLPVISADTAAATHNGHFIRGDASIAASKIPAGNQIERPDPGIVHMSSVIAAAKRQTT